MHLTLGSRSYDLCTRALVMAGAGVSGDLVDQGADLLDLDLDFDLDHPLSVPLPLSAAASGDDSIRRALAAGVTLVRLPQPTPASLAMCAEAAAAVVVRPGAMADAAAAGVPPERIVPDTLLLDVTSEDLPSPATAVGVIRGARIVRTADIVGARRICDVLAAVLEAG